MEKLEKIITEDGSISFYNNEIGDIYHSKVGAYTESYEKFVKPSKVLENLDNYLCINVLDVCFGLGYNSKVLTNCIFSQNPNKKINLTCIEIDPQIIKKSGDINFPEYNEDLKEFFDGFLHKVYYTTYNLKPDNSTKFSDSFKSLGVDLYVSDARKIVKQLNDTYDLVLLDPFSPQKAPELWTTDFFKLLFKLLKDNGKLITYSSSICVRGGLIEAGFLIGNTDPVGRKSPGTIAAKTKDLIENPLTNHQNDLINSRSGIPFYDPDLVWSTLEILEYRKLLQNKSLRKSASSVIKSYQQD